jgi:macrolide transport system ATP-binding/permease protein
MRSFFRKVAWWTQRRGKEDELREELQFHLAEEAEERQADGLSEEQAKSAARRDLGNATLLREDARTLWTWTLLEQLAQDLRYAVRVMGKHRAFTALAALSLALGIGANTAIYSFMDSILLRSLPVSDPASLVVVKWRAKPFAYGSRAVNGSEFLVHSMDGSFFPAPGGGTTADIFPFPAFEHLRQVSESVLSSLFGHYKAGELNVMVKGAAELATGEYVSGDFFQGLEVPPAAGRLLLREDDLVGAPPVAVISMGYSQRRFGGPANAIDQPILINNVAFTVVGVTPSEFFGVDPAAAPHVYLPMRAGLLFDPVDAGQRLADPNYYWLEMMGRLRPGVSLAQAQAALRTPFEQWVIPTATNDRERANPPVLELAEGAGGLDTLRRQYSKPLYVLLAMVGLILAIACANTANLLLARATARKREMAVRLSIGAGRFRLVRQLLTESVLLAALSGALGVIIAVIGMRLLTSLLANGQEGFTLHAELNWHVLAVTLGLSLLCGTLFGLAPALQATRPALFTGLKDRSGSSDTRAGMRLRVLGGIPRLSLTQALVAAQIAISLLLLVAAGLFVRTLSNLQSIQLGFNREGVLLFEVNAPQAGHPEARVAAFYGDLRQRVSEIPGVRDVTLSHASLVRAGRGHPVTIDGQPTRNTRILIAGPRFFATMQIPMRRGREFGESDRLGTLPVVVVSDLFAKVNFGDQDPIGRHIEIGGSMKVDDAPVVMEIVGVAATARYGPLKREIPPVVYVSYAQVPPPQLRGMTFAVRSEGGDPLRHVATVRQIVRDADSRVPVTNVKTQAADIDQTINQEIVFARLCTAFAILALVIACVGLYATMAYTVARRTSEIGIRMALGARRGSVIWMVVREVCVLVVSGVAISIPIVFVTSRLIESFLFDMQPNDPRALTLAVTVLAIAALLAAYGPARRASRVDPMIALRHE